MKVHILMFSCQGMSDSDPMAWNKPGLPVLIVSRSLSKFMSIESVMPSNHLILCCPLLLLPSILPSIRVFSSELALRIRWPKYWSFSFNNSPPNEYSGLISFRTDWSDSVMEKQITQTENSCGCLGLTGGRGSKESWFNKQGVSTDNSKEALKLNSDDGFTTLWMC